MSRKRVVTGADERGRPRATWEGLTDPEPRYGHMEPAYSTAIERRQATPDELAAARAREARPLPWSRASTASATTPAQVQQSRVNGAKANQIRAARAREAETIAASVRHPAPEEAPEDLISPDLSVNGLVTGEPAPESPDAPPDPVVEQDAWAPIGELAMAAMDAEKAYQLYLVAAPRWELARARLAEAWRSVHELIEPGSVLAAALRDELVAVGVRKVSTDEARGVVDRLMHAGDRDHPVPFLDKLEATEAVVESPSDHAETIPAAIPEPAEPVAIEGGPGARVGSNLAKLPRDPLVRDPMVAQALREAATPIYQHAAKALGISSQRVSQLLRDMRDRGTVPADVEAKMHDAKRGQSR